MKLTINEAFRKGVAAHKAGDVQLAERYYRAVLTSNPNNAYANRIQKNLLSYNIENDRQLYIQLKKSQQNLKNRFLVKLDVGL